MNINRFALRAALLLLAVIAIFLPLTLSAREKQYLNPKPVINKNGAPLCQSVNDKEFVELLNKLRLVHEQELKNTDLRIRVFIVNMPVGSAGGASGDVAQTVYIVASTYKNEEMAMVYWLPPMWSPHYESLEELAGYAVLLMSYQTSSGRQPFQVKVSNNGATTSLPPQ